MRPVYCAIVLVLLSAPASARSAAAEYLVRKQIAEACEGKQGKIDPAAVIERDLTGDGKADLVTSHQGIICADRTRGGFCGAQLCSVNIYVRRGALLELEHEMLGVNVSVKDGVIHLYAHGGKPGTVRWSGRAFVTGSAANVRQGSAPTGSATSSAPPSAALSSASSPGADALDGFLSGLLPECEGSPEFNRFRSTLNERHGHNADGSPIKPNHQVAVPERIKPLIGRAVASNKGQFTQVLVPLRGRFRSLTVTELEFSFGNENGINAAAVIFEEPLQRVRAVLGSAVAEGKKRLKAVEEKGDAGGEIAISAVRGRAALVCDLST